MFFKVIFCLALVAVSYNTGQVIGETTANPHGNHTHHREPTETDSYSFYYDGATHMLLVLQGTKCYIWTLTHAQRQVVHTDDGLRSIELKVLHDIDSALYTAVNSHILATSIIHGCGKHATAYYVVH